jgi:hypothetical protein
MHLATSKYEDLVTAIIAHVDGDTLCKTPAVNSQTHKAVNTSTLRLPSAYIKHVSSTKRLLDKTSPYKTSIHTTSP